jgi:hypothetical protein
MRVLIQETNNNILYYRSIFLRIWFKFCQKSAALQDTATSVMPVISATARLDDDDDDDDDDNDDTLHN